MSKFYDCTNSEERIVGITTAVEAVKHDEIIVMPTDTLYGIGGDAFSEAAVEKIFAAKARKKSLALPVLVGSLDTIFGLTDRVSQSVENLIKNFWPGGLSILLDKASSLKINLGNNNGKILVRMPFNSVALEILNQVGPMAVTSANISGQPPCMDTQSASAQFGEEVSVYLSGDVGVAGLPSTIIDMSSNLEIPRILRDGVVSTSDIAKILNIDENLL